MPKKTKYFFAIFILSFFCNCVTQKKTKSNKKGNIEIYINDNNSSYIINDTIFIPTFSFVVKNNTDSITSFYEDWNMWGYYNFFLEVKKGADSIRIYRKHRTGWDKNYPSFRSLKQGDSIMIKFSKNCQYRWDDFQCIPEKFDGISKIKIVHHLIKENHRFEDLLQFLSFFPSKKDSTKIQKIFQSFTTERIVSKEYDLEVQNGSFRILNK